MRIEKTNTYNSWTEYFSDKENIRSEGWKESGVKCCSDDDKIHINLVKFE